MENQLLRSSDIIADMENNQNLLKESSGRVRSYLNLPALPFESDNGDEGRGETPLSSWPLMMRWPI